MTFTFNPLPILSPEQQNPLNAFISNALKGYQGLKKASYLPKQLEADIFSKEIGPLASLASSPNFTGFNPEVQKLIAERIGKYLTHGQAGMGKGSTESAPGYASGGNVFDRLKQGLESVESPGGRGNVVRSTFGGTLKKIVGENPISKALGGGNAADEEAQFEQAKAEAAQLLRMKNYSEDKIYEILRRRTGESIESTLKRWKPLFVSAPKESPITSSDQKESQDAQDRMNAHHTAKLFNTTPEVVLEAQSMGVKSAKEFREFLKWRAGNG